MFSVSVFIVRLSVPVFLVCVVLVVSIGRTAWNKTDWLIDQLIDWLTCSLHYVCNINVYFLAKMCCLPELTQLLHLLLTRASFLSACKETVEVIVKARRLLKRWSHHAYSCYHIKHEYKSCMLIFIILTSWLCCSFPNAGKSTLLKALSRASPRIASYPCKYRTWWSSSMITTLIEGFAFLTPSIS